MPRRVLRPAEVQRRLGIGHTRFYEIVGAGKLRLVRLGERSVGVIEDELDDYIGQLADARGANAALVSD
jgi:predicted DNA-binding transcriptional regulator AlpA